MPPGLDVTVYEVMLLPPLEAGGEKLTVARAFPAVALTLVGASGIAAGVTLFEETEAGPVPTAFDAFTVNVYAVPLVRPVTVIGLAAPLWVMLPGFEVTVYEIMGLPPV
jgi:hypothetical protein